MEAALRSAGPQSLLINSNHSRDRKKCGEAGLIFGKLYSRIRRACSSRGKGPAGDSLRRLDGVWNAWSDCHRRCAGRCIGDEARILPTVAHGCHARSERAVTAFFVRLTMALRFLAGRVVWPKEKPAGVNRQGYCDPELVLVCFWPLSSDHDLLRSARPRRHLDRFLPRHSGKLPCGTARPWT